MNSRVLPFETSRQARRPSRPPQDEPDRVDVRELGRMMWRRRRVVLGATFIGAALMLVAAHMMTPLYDGVSKVMLDARRAPVSSPQTVVPDLQLNDQLVNSEVAVLSSNVLIGKVVDKLGMDALKPIDPTLKPPSLISRVKSRIDGLLGRSVAKKAAPVGLSPEQLHHQALVWAVLRDLKIAREGQSYVIDIRVKTPDPALSASLANTIATEYINSQLSQRQATAANATRFLSDRVKQLQAQVAAAEAKVEQFRAQNLLVDGGTLDAANQQLAQLNTQLVAARADRIAAEARYDRIHQVLEKGGVDAAAKLVTSPALETLSSQLMDLQRQDAIWAQNYGPKHPERVRLAKEISGLKTDLDQEVRKIVDQRKNDVDIARIREQTMQDSLKKMESRVVELSRSTIGLRQLEREASAARGAYEQLLARVTDTQTQEQMQRPDATLIENATISTSQASPRPKLMAVAGGMGGLVIGLALVFFLEMTSVTYRAASELEGAVDLPVLASVPKGAWKSPLGAWRELAQNPYGAYAERIRHLRTALLLRDGPEAARAIMLVSSLPGEGKTTTTLALARMAALAGKKVIVVDCDLRRASLYRSFGWTADRDFADFIANRCALADAIHRDSDLGFDVLAASRPQPDAADEMSDGWLAPMIETLKDHYDLVLVDAPALMAVPDALMVGQAVDVSLFLVRWNATRRTVVAKALADCAEAGVTLTGTVLTMVDPRHSPDLYAEGYDYSA